MTRYQSTPSSRERSTRIPRLRRELENAGVLPATALLLFAGVAPLLLLGVYSFFLPTITWLEPGFTISNYIAILETGRLPVVTRTIWFAVVSTAASMMLGYPVAYYLARVAGLRIKAVILAAFVVPFILSPLIRYQGIRHMLGPEGIVNQLLMAVGIIREPLGWLLYSDQAVYIGIVLSYLPLAIFPVWLAIQASDRRLIEAASDLGASPIRSFAWVVFPLSLPGVFAGIIFIFISVLGEMSAPDILGGPTTLLVGNMLQDVINSVQFPLAAAIATLVLVLMLALLFLGEWRLRISSLFSPFQR